MSSTSSGPPVGANPFREPVPPARQWELVPIAARPVLVYQKGAVDIVASTAGLFIADSHTRAIVLYVPETGIEGPKYHVLAGDQTNPNRLAVDGDEAWWTNWGTVEGRKNVGGGRLPDGSFWTGRHGSDPRVLAKAKSVPRAVAVNASQVYFIEEGAGRLYSIERKDGGKLLPRYAVSSSTTQLAAGGNDVFWIDGERGGLHKNGARVPGLEIPAYAHSLAYGRGILAWIETQGRSSRIARIAYPGLMFHPPRVLNVSERIDVAAFSSDCGQCFYASADGIRMIDLRADTPKILIATLDGKRTVRQLAWDETRLFFVDEFGKVEALICPEWGAAR